MLHQHVSAVGDRILEMALPVGRQEEHRTDLAEEHRIDLAEDRRDDQEEEHHTGREVVHQIDQEVAHCTGPVVADPILAAVAGHRILVLEAVHSPAEVGNPAVDILKVVSLHFRVLRPRPWIEKSGSR